MRGWMGARVRAKVESFLTETALIEKEQASFDVYGERSTGWETVAEDVACRIYDAGEQNRAMASQVGSAEVLSDMFKLALPVGTELEANYRVTVGGRVYQVVSIVDDRTDAMDVQAVVQRIRA